jgi:hypothetical protein
VAPLRLAGYPATLMISGSSISQWPDSLFSIFSFRQIIRQPWSNFEWLLWTAQTLAAMVFRYGRVLEHSCDLPAYLVG